MRRVERIDSAVEFEDIRCPAMRGLGHGAVGESLEDAIIPDIVSLGQVPLCVRLAEFQMVDFEAWA